MPAIAQLIDEVRRGTVGTVEMVAIREHRFPFLAKVGNWNRFNRNTGGTLVEKCCHFFDLMNLIADSDPVRVYASGGQDVNHLDEVYDGEASDILDNALVVVEYDSGIRAVLDLCMFAEVSKYQGEVSVVGARGKIEALTPGPWPFPGRGEQRLRIGDRATGAVTELEPSDERIRVEGGHHGSSYLEHVGFRNAVLSGGNPEVTLVDGLRSVAIGVAAHRSIDEGRVVDMHEVLGRG
jgi:predicted dehydrogenase